MLAHRGITLVAVLCLSAMALSCSDKSTNSDGEDEDSFLPRTSPENLLENLLLAYKHRDVAQFDSLLDDEFVFYPAEGDQHLGKRFLRAAEIPIHEGMFDRSLVGSLNLSYMVGEITLDEEKTTPEDSIWVVTLSNVDLYLLGKHPQFPDEDPQGYEMENGRERFWFHRTWQGDPDTGEPIWTIIEWLELPFEREVPGTPNSSWGEIKALFGPWHGPFLPRISPENLLRNLLRAYELRDVAQFDSLLDRDFVFFFSEEDQDIGERLVRSQEIPIHDAMFGAAYVQHLSLSYHIDDIELDEEATSPADSIWVTTVTNVDLYLYGTTPQFPDEPWGYEMDDGWERFRFHRTGWTDPYKGEPVWTIVEWREMPYGQSPGPRTRSETTTWGSVKALFL